MKTVHNCLLVVFVGCFLVATFCGTDACVPVTTPVPFIFGNATATAQVNTTGSVVGVVLGRVTFAPACRYTLEIDMVPSTGVIADTGTFGLCNGANPEICILNSGETVTLPTFDAGGKGACNIGARLTFFSQNPANVTQVFVDSEHDEMSLSCSNGVINGTVREHSGATQSIPGDIYLIDCI